MIYSTVHLVVVACFPFLTMPCSADRFEVTLSDGLGVKKEELDLFLQLFDYIPGFQQQQGLGVSSGCFNTSAI